MEKATRNKERKVRMNIRSGSARSLYRFMYNMLNDAVYDMVTPDIVGDFTQMPFPDRSYKLVIWDPPHLVWAGKTSNLYKMFGRLDDWREELRKGYEECMRVLDDYGVLVFKWSDVQLKVKTVLKAIGATPLVGHKTSKHTVWMVFMKMPEKKNNNYQQ